MTTSPMARWVRVAGLALVATLAVLGPRPAAHACVWDGSMELDEARDLLAQGDWSAAASMVTSTKKYSLKLPTTTDPEDADIAFDLQQVLALAIVRSDGKATPEVIGLSEKGIARPAFGLAWARFVLEYRVASGRNDPRDILALGEALATDPLMRPRARAMLRALADKDVMPNERGTKLLAELDREAAS